MEYCGAGSVLDIMKLRGLYWSFPKSDVKPLSEDEIATVLSDTLKGLEYLHLRKKIHRDTMAKRNTVIGTPFWMAPEVIQEIGYDCVADIWSLGITALEMAEGKPPYGDIHPMRAIFMIPTKPPPTFRDSDRWSPQFIDFVSRCLVKTPEKRATASQLLHSDFIVGSGSCNVVADMIAEAAELRDKVGTSGAFGSTSSGTMVPGDQGTLVSLPGDQGTFVNHSTGGGDSGTMINYSEGTMVQHNTGPGTAVSRTMSEIESNLGTMVINNSLENTMKQYGTAPGQQNYRPDFMDHFDQKESGSHTSPPASNANHQGAMASTHPVAGAGAGSVSVPPSPHTPSQDVTSLEQQQAGRDLARQLQQIAGGASVSSPTGGGMGPGGGGRTMDMDKFQRSITDGDFEFLKFLSYDELTGRLLVQNVRP